MINPYHQVAVQSERGRAEHLGFLYRTPCSQSPSSTLIWAGARLPIMRLSSQEHSSQLKKEKCKRVEALPVFMSPGVARPLALAPAGRASLTHLDKLYSFVLHSADLGLWKQEAAIQREGHDIGGDSAIVLFRLESHDDLVIRVGDELEG